MDSIEGSLKNKVGWVERLVYGGEMNGSDNKIETPDTFSINSGRESSLFKVKFIIFETGRSKKRSAICLNRRRSL